MRKKGQRHKHKAPQGHRGCPEQSDLEVRKEIPGLEPKALLDPPGPPMELLGQSQEDETWVLIPWNPEDSPHPEQEA